MRVLVTRPEPDAGATAERLRGRGHDPLLAPLMTAVPVAEPLPLARPDGLALTSGRAIAFLDPALMAAFRHLPVFAVGERTAAVLVETGFADVRPAGGDVRSLARLIAAADLPEGSRILHPGGEDRAGDLRALLAGTGLTAVPWTVYRMEPAATLPAAAVAALREGRIDAVLHYSPRSAATFAALAVGDGLARAAAGPLHACLSEAVAAALSPLRPGMVRIAARPDEMSLMRLLDGRSGCG
ncbi:uroporphyrinogen-III synthase [Phreatobacter sp.]|uniref:uroporphyrinogen-III synthase n=1 Tax=Phreatobacter sp. TaxID=1966341 RepID=UPI003F6F8593